MELHQEVCLFLCLAPKNFQSEPRKNEKPVGMDEFGHGDHEECLGVAAMAAVAIVTVIAVSATATLVSADKVVGTATRLNASKACKAGPSIVFVLSTKAVCRMQDGSIRSRLTVLDYVTASSDVVGAQDADVVSIVAIVITTSERETASLEKWIPSSNNNITK